MRLNEDEIESWAVRISYWPYAPHLLLEGEKKKRYVFCRDQDGFINGLSMVTLVY